MGTGGLSAGAEWSGHEVKRSPPTSGELKKEWSYTLTSPRVFMAWRVPETTLFCLSKYAPEIKCYIGLRLGMSTWTVTWLRAFTSRAITQAVSRWLLTAEARVCVQAILCGICSVMGRSLLDAVQPCLILFHILFESHLSLIMNQQKKKNESVTQDGFES